VLKIHKVGYQSVRLHLKQEIYLSAFLRRKLCSCSVSFLIDCWNGGRGINIKQQEIGESRLRWTRDVDAICWTMPPGNILYESKECADRTISDHRAQPLPLPRLRGQSWKQKSNEENSSWQEHGEDVARLCWRQWSRQDHESQRTLTCSDLRSSASCQRARFDRKLVLRNDRTMLIRALVFFF
jgi:hypothetical protein